MSEIFLAYRLTGENKTELKPILGKLTDALRKVGHDIFCSIELEDQFKKDGLTLDERYAYCLEQLQTRKIFLAFIRNEYESKGMKWESEQAITQGTTYILAIKKGLEFPGFRKAASRIIEYETLTDLCEQLRTI